MDSEDVKLGRRKIWRSLLIEDFWGNPSWDPITSPRVLPPSHEQQMGLQINKLVSILQQGTALAFPSFQALSRRLSLPHDGQEQCNVCTFPGKSPATWYPKAMKKPCLGFTVKLAPKASKKQNCHQWSTIQFLTWWEWQRSQNSSPHWNDYPPGMVQSQLPVAGVPSAIHLQPEWNASILAP